MSKSNIVKVNGFNINTELITRIEVVDATGYFGDFDVKTKTTPTQYDLKILVMGENNSTEEINILSIEKQPLNVLLSALTCGEVVII